MCQQLLRITNKKTEGVVVASHSTYRLDPVIEIRPSLNQIDDLIEEIQIRAEIDERVLVTTLTKKERGIAKYLTKVNIRCYIHSDIDTLERIEIMQDLRKGLFDVLIGVNLLVTGFTGSITCGDLGCR
jgi:excinuclease ABC subunit B